MAADYFYLKASGDFSRDEESATALVMYDLRSGMPGATMVAAKGPDPFAVKFGARFLDFLGYNKLVLKIDGEPALVDYARKLKNQRRG